MSLFSGEDVYIIDVSTTRLTQDDYTTRMSQAVARSILDDGDVVKYIISNIQNGLYSKLKLYMSYARSDYVYGLPSSNVNNDVVDRDEVQKLLDSYHGEPTTITHLSLLSPPSLTFVGTYWLQQNYDYNISTDKLYLPGDPFPWNYLGTTNYRDPNNPYSPTIVRVSITRDDIESGQTLVQYFDITSSYHEDLHYEILYYVTSKPERIIVVLYRLADNTAPTLSKPPTYVPDTGLVPVVPFRKFFQNFSEEWNPTEYASCKKILSKLPINIDELGNAVNEGENSNLVKHGFIVYAINLYAENNAQITYLIHFFLFLRDHSSVSYLEWQAYIDKAEEAEEYNSNVDPENLTYIDVGAAPVNSYNVTEDFYNTTIEYNYIEITIEDGVLGDIGHVSSELIIENPWYYGPYTAYTMQKSHMVYTYQHEANKYYRMVVHGLVHVTTIKETDDTDAYVKRSLYNPSLEESEENQKTNFIIPLQEFILEKLTVREREDVLYDSLNLVLYAEDVQELAWYQTKSFLGLVQIVSIFLSAVGVGRVLQLAIEAGKTLGATLVQILLQKVLPTVLIKLAGRYVLEGNKDMAILVTLVGVALANRGGAIHTLFTSGKFTVAALMRAVTDTFKVVQVGRTAENNNLMLTLEEDREQEAIQEELDNYTRYPAIYDTTYMLQRIQYDYFNETPEEYYNRTTHTGNPGVAVLEGIRLYVPSALKLPEANETMII